VKIFLEIEKTRETSWRIQLKNRNENIEITSVEISGEVRLVKLALINNENSVQVEMNKEEFFNFLSLISAFKDVVIGEGASLIEESETLLENEIHESDEISNVDDDLYTIDHEPTKRTFRDSEKDELNPEEWDPW
jgi:hypothetical protein